MEPPTCVRACVRGCVHVWVGVIALIVVGSYVPIATLVHSFVCGIHMSLQHTYIHFGGLLCR